MSRYSNIVEVEDVSEPVDVIVGYDPAIDGFFCQVFLDGPAAEPLVVGEAHRLTTVGELVEKMGGLGGVAEEFRVELERDRMLCPA